MSGLFWSMLAVAALFGGLLFAALPFGPDLIFACGYGPLLGAVFMLGWKFRDQERERLGVPPPDHPLWRQRQS
jgi:hypothetical protein